MIQPGEIAVYEDGRPIEGHPGPKPPADASLDERLAWVDAWQAYAQRVTDVANRAFHDQFMESMGRARPKRKKR